MASRMNNMTLDNHFLDGIRISRNAFHNPTNPSIMKANFFTTILRSSIKFSLSFFMAKHYACKFSIGIGAHCHALYLPEG